MMFPFTILLFVFSLMKSIECNQFVKLSFDTSEPSLDPTIQISYEPTNEITMEVSSEPTREIFDKIGVK